ncbi:hypothetical protein BT63DRAFT_449389 [Microthyrium microscopicum]|uniref:Vacuolar ATPase assembly protein VMA22 n=1 Tax=Microthyrium microscopicum TaxID=703497 RepID=A0A6A6USK7_9PEZI|nr:hypothetical protein BT63DRAFT_449389 [Microthyrium microscopicum]
MSSSPELEQHITALDALLEQYLYLLDEHQKARETLHKSLSLGFISLARANSSAQGGKRFGQDDYDYRMQATKLVQVDSLNKDVLKYSVLASKISEATPDKTISSTEAESSQQADDKPNDPIRWFGMIVPNALKDTQAQFVTAVGESVPQILNISTQMRQLEIDIGRSRKAIKRLEKSDASILPTI